MSIEVLKTKKDEIVKNAMFFSKNEDEIKFDFEIRGYKGKSVKSEIVHVVSGSKSAPIEMPVDKETVKFGLKNLDNFLELGEYQIIVTLSADRKVILPFFIVDEVSSQDESWTLKFSLMAKNDKNENIITQADVIAQLINLDNESVIVNNAMKVKTSTETGIQIKRTKDAWEKGRYEFRVSSANSVIYRKFYIVK